MEISTRKKQIRHGKRETEGGSKREGRKGIEGGVSIVREGAAFVNVCGHVSVCGCVTGREGKLGEVPHHFNKR